MSSVMTTRTRLLSTTVLASVGLLLAAPAFGQAAESMETVTVTGYRASLQDSTNAKRASVSFTDAVYAEDIGKFPDSNIAESLNRIPGVTIARDNDGEGVNVQIRGLGTNFTKILLNNAQVAVASTGGIDSSNNNREVDLNMFPTELFTQLTVSKSSSADNIEGGAAGTVNMRSQRPFDKEGAHLTYTMQGTNLDGSNADGYRGALIASDTWGPFGALLGVAGVHSMMMTTGWEDGNAGWVTPTFNAAQCGTGNTCDQIGGNSMGVPSTVPVNVTKGGLVAGQTVNQALLYSLNPGLGTPNQTSTILSNLLIPRLGRTMYERGSRDRYNGVASFEFRPSDDLHFYLDMIGGRTFNAMDRSDLDWGVRSGAGAQSMIPEAVTCDPASLAALNNLGCVAQSGTFANAQFFLEARPYQEKGDFFSINPGMSWQVADKLHVDLQLNATRSHFFRDSPTFFLVTCPSAGNAGAPGCNAPVGGVNAIFSNTGATPYPSITSNLDLNNPNNYQWNNGRVNLQDEKRYTFTQGTHLDVSYGGDEMMVKAGVAYDDVGRTIVAIDASQQWQNAICGDNPSQFLATGSPTNNSNPACNGLNVTGNAATVNAALPGYAPAYPGYGTGQSTGWAPINYGGSLIPQSALASYLQQGPTGFVTVNYDKAKAASNYYALDAAAIQAVTNGVLAGNVTYPYSTSSNTGGNSGGVEEKNYGLYAKVTGDVPFASRHLKYDFGLRWVETHQYITSPTQHNNPANPTLADGGYYPATYTFAKAEHTYQAFLPSMNLVYEVADDFQVRFSASRTMTRPNPTQMESVANFSDLTANSLTLGNPDLKPYYSNNIDIGAELYTGGEGYIGVALFRKSIAGFPAQVNITQPFSYLSQFGIIYSGLLDGQKQAICSRSPSCTNWQTETGANVSNTTITVTQQTNQPGLEIINGMEWDYVQPLDFFLEQYGLKGFGFTGNVTILDASSTGSAPVHPTGIAPLQYNMTAYYDNDGIMVRGSYNWNDRVYGSGSNTQSVCLPTTTISTCPNGAYIYGAPYGQFDMSSSIKLDKFFGELPSDPELSFDVQNLFHSKMRSYDQFTNAIHSYYNPGALYMIGVRGTF